MCSPRGITDIPQGELSLFFHRILSKHVTLHHNYPTSDGGGDVGLADRITMNMERSNKMTAMITQRWFMHTLLALVLAGIATGCATSRRYSSSVVQYLYPDQNAPIQAPEVPQLSVPLKVGIAFVPNGAEEKQSYSPASQYGAAPLFGAATLAATLTEKDKMLLMQNVSDHFKKYEFVKSIDLIPSAYLRPKGSFANLDQIRTMHGVDVIVLLSYDQTQFVDEGISSISYWTMVGAYIVKGEKNDTHTMLDAAVFHISSRKMLFRAPGISHIKNAATPVNLSEQARVDSIAGFQEASKDLITHLDEQLELFRARLKESPDEFKVIYKPGYTGGGSLDVSFVVMAFVLLACHQWYSRRESR